jgi:hypothetical protein
MIRNFSLLAFLILLLVATYQFQEKRVLNEIQKELIRDKLVDFEVSHLKLINFEAEKKKHQWWNNNQLLSHTKFKLIEKKLNEIKMVKEIKGNWKDFSSRPFNFEINHVPWSIGDFSLDKKSFYLMKGSHIYLATIDGASHQVTVDEDEIPRIKKDELLMLLNEPLEGMKESQLFRFFPDLPTDRFIFKTDSMVSFEIDLKNNQTIPSPINGIYVHQDLRKKIMALLTLATIRKEIPFNEGIKGKKISEVVFINSNKTLKWELWFKNNNTADAVIIEPSSKKAFLMIGGTLKLFFVQIQEYWDKKIIPQKSFFSFQTIKTIFTQGSRKAEVVIFNKEPLEFQTKKFKIDSLKMDELIKIIFNLGPWDQASRVSILSNSERKHLLSGDNLHILVMDQELILLRKAQELIVANLTQGFKSHFIMLNENFPGSFQDVLK